jgi:isoleucyl-tRNA synthetase
MFFITSGVTVAEGDALGVEVSRAAGDKCPRCWRVVTERRTGAGADPADALCPRCIEAVGDVGVLAG